MNLRKGWPTGQPFVYQSQADAIHSYSQLTLLAIAFGLNMGTSKAQSQKP
ncbi:MAG: hypothetical protein AAF579_19275 [Cyanobacteria bacterium P01_C01_bin.118]